MISGTWLVGELHRLNEIHRRFGEFWRCNVGYMKLWGLIWDKWLSDLVLASVGAGCSFIPEAQVGTHDVPCSIIWLRGINGFHLMSMTFLALSRQENPLAAHVVIDKWCQQVILVEAGIGMLLTALFVSSRQFRKWRDGEEHGWREFRLS